MNSSSPYRRIILNITAIAVMSGFLLVPPAHASVQSEIDIRNQRIAELERQIQEYQRQADEVGAQASTLAVEVKKLNAQIGQLTAQIRSLEANIERTDLEIGQTESAVTEAERKLQLNQDALAEALRATAAADQKPLSHLLLQHAAISEFFNYLNSVERTQDNLRLAIRSIKDLRVDLDSQLEGLEEKQGDLEHLRGLQELQQRQLAGTKGTKDKILKQTLGQEDKFQELVKKGQQDLQRLRQEISYLLAGGLSLENAISYAKLAAIGAGIRPAFLLALLDTESRLGQNVGTGNWQDDMYLCYLRISKLAKTAERRQYYINRAETEKNAFLAIMGKLGLDPASVKVSREPSYGCGGAMGPAQFIPSTWLGYEAEAMRITGHNPVSPWNFQDAFSASAAKLARGGATSKDATGETRAAKAYISGNPSCITATCNNYAATILKKAADIERDL